MTTLDYKRMKDVCLARLKDFKSIGDVTQTRDGMYIYRDNPKAKILAVAHLDTVLDLNHFYRLSIGKDTVIMNAQLDDRLGAYVLLDVLPQMGIEYDLLLTEGEETGRSTAKYFKAHKSYNWMFSFDRHGNDVVMYQYDNKPLRDDLKQAGLKPGLGSFSDIAFLGHLGICGMNFGTGYEGEHSDMCYASMNVLKRQLTGFKAFYDMFKDKKYPHVKSENIMTGGPSYARFGMSDYDDLYCYLCNKHRGTVQVMNDIWLCNDCIGDAAQCTECQDIVYANELMDGICVNCEDSVIDSRLQDDTE